MKFGKLSVLLVSGAMMFVYGCAKTGSTDYDVFEKQSLAAWMNKTYPGWESDNDFVVTDDGVYIQWLEHSTLSAPADSLAEKGDWVRINYTGRTLQEDVFYTRNAHMAKVQGTFTRHTHYVPNFVYLSTENTAISAGTYQALLKMKTGDIVRVFMPSGMYKGTSGYSNDNVGYNGQNGVDGNIPVIIDSLKLMEIATDPIVSENKTVTDYAVGKWNMNAADSLKGYEGVYVQLMTPFPFKRDSVVTDSTMSFYYKGYFTDGFVFDSNIDSVQMRAWGEITSSGPKEWDMTATDSSADDYFNPIEGFRQACYQACYGDRIRVIFTSAYGYGITGKSATRTSDSSSSSSSYSDYYNYLNYYSYLNSMYGSGGYGYGGYGYGGYGSSYYDSYYSSLYYNSLYNSTSSSTTTTEEEKIYITTEILPFTPLIFEIYVCANDGSQTTPDGNTE